jgi:hypothetical protein
LQIKDKEPGMQWIFRKDCMNVVVRVVKVIRALVVLKQQGPPLKPL